MKDYKYADADHRLLCKQGLARSYYYYTQRCIVLKEMPDGKRLKVVTFGDRATDYPPLDLKWRIRYVDESRVQKYTKGVLSEWVVRRKYSA